eukprot:gene39334-25197_t
MAMKCVTRELVIFSGDFSFTTVLGRPLSNHVNYTQNERMEIELYDSNWE